MRWYIKFRSSVVAPHYILLAGFNSTRFKIKIKTNSPHSPPPPVN